MSKSVTDQVTARIDQLMARAAAVTATHKPPSPGVARFQTLDTGKFVEWRSAVENLIVNIAGKDSVYHQNFCKNVKSGRNSDVNAGVGILQSLKEDIELGFLKGVCELVSAEVFSDLLDIADHLLKNGYKDPAASLTGAVLENGLKHLASSHNIRMKSGDDIGVVNAKLADAGVYNRLVQKQIQAWKAIRDSADHGKFNDYTNQDVQAVIEGVARFLGNLS